MQLTTKPASQSDAQVFHCRISTRCSSCYGAGPPRPRCLRLSVVQLCCPAELRLLTLLPHPLLCGPLLSALCSFPPLSTCLSPVLHLLFMDWILKAPSLRRKPRVRLRFASASALRQDTALQRPLRLPYVSPPLRRPRKLTQEAFASF